MLVDWETLERDQNRLRVNSAVRSARYGGVDQDNSLRTFHDFDSGGSLIVGLFDAYRLRRARPQPSYHEAPHPIVTQSEIAGTNDQLSARLRQCNVHFRIKHEEMWESSISGGLVAVIANEERAVRARHSRRRCVSRLC